MTETTTTHDYDIAVLLPTRGRTLALTRSIFSLMNRAQNVGRIKLMIGLDEDDTMGREHFLTEIQPELDRRGIHWEALEFEPLGYIRLNEYVNELARNCRAQWYFFWNDDAMMETTNWDQAIMNHTDFNILAVHTHREHPYSIFPIVPAGWMELFGYLSPHQMSDAWISQVAYLVDIWQRIDVWVTHDRYDLTGNNHDDTYKNRPQLEGNPANPDDFHSERWHQHRIQDCEKLSAYLESQGYDQTWWHEVKDNRQNPWEKLQANDVNNQMTQSRTDNANLTNLTGTINVPTA